jgi:hypothetical protein
VHDTCFPINPLAEFTTPLDSSHENTEYKLSELTSADDTRQTVARAAATVLHLLYLQPDGSISLDATVQLQYIL